MLYADNIDVILDDFSCDRGPLMTSWLHRQLQDVSVLSWRQSRTCSNQKYLPLRLSQTGQDLHDALHCGRCQKIPSQEQICISNNFLTGFSQVPKKNAMTFKYPFPVCSRLYSDVLNVIT